MGWEKAFPEPSPRLLDGHAVLDEARNIELQHAGWCFGAGVSMAMTPIQGVDFSLERKTRAPHASIWL